MKGRDVREIIILEHEKFTIRKRKHYYIDKFAEEGFDFEYWDLNPMLSKSNSVDYDDKPDFVYVAADREEVVDRLSKLDRRNSVLIIEVLYNVKSLWLYKEVYKLGLKWVRINYYHNPTNYLNPSPSLKDSIEKALDFKRLIRAVKYNHIRRMSYTAEPDLLFLTGNTQYESNKNSVRIDFFDIEEYNTTEITPTYYEGEYIVFLDIMFPNHPDFKRYQISTVSKELYFSKMNTFFDRLERDLRMPVVIASHPKANYTDEFMGRKVIVGNTMSLVTYSNLVVTHGSLSISFALLERKPLLYIYFEEMLKSVNMRFYYKRMVKAANELGAGLINIDEGTTIESLPAVDPDLYQAFLERVYLKDRAENRNNFQIIRDNLNKLIHTT